MVISIWPSRPTTREKAPLTGRTEFPAFERLATTSKKYRMRITGQVRGDLQRTCLIPTPSARTRNLPAALSSLTTKSSITQKSAPGLVQRNFSTRKFAGVAEVFVGTTRVRKSQNVNAETRISRSLAETAKASTVKTLSRQKTASPCRNETASRGTRTRLSADLVLVLGVYSFRSTGMRF
jgi:hypothetical protein